MLLNHILTFRIFVCLDYMYLHVHEFQTQFIVSTHAFTSRLKLNSKLPILVNMYSI